MVALDHLRKMVQKFKAVCGLIIACHIAVRMINLAERIKFRMTKIRDDLIKIAGYKFLKNVLNLGCSTSSLSNREE